jgi:hypothetical protein
MEWDKYFLDGFNSGTQLAMDAKRLAAERERERARAAAEKEWRTQQLERDKDKMVKETEWRDKQLDQKYKEFEYEREHKNKRLEREFEDLRAKRERERVSGIENNAVLDAMYNGKDWARKRIGELEMIPGGSSSPDNASIIAGLKKGINQIRGAENKVDDRNYTTVYNVTTNPDTGVKMGTEQRFYGRHPGLPTVSVSGLTPQPDMRPLAAIEERINVLRGGKPPETVGGNVMYGPSHKLTVTDPNYNPDLLRELEQSLPAIKAAVQNPQNKENLEFLKAFNEKYKIW